jgi:Spy/CpxP family protein refolding chaperone
MYPGMMHWWKHARRFAGCGAAAGCGPSHSGESGFEASEGEYGGGGFGVRRPLRFLAYKLELNDHQVKELAKILSELKTERAQADVDGRRTLAAFADAISGETFDEAKAGEAAALRVRSAERIRDAVLQALRRFHALLDTEQRAKLAYLIRTGTVVL